MVIVGRVEYPAGESGLSEPSGQPRPVEGSGGHDHVSRVPGAGAALDTPLIIRPYDPVGVHCGVDWHRVLPGILVQVPHVLVPSGELSPRSGERGTGQGRVQPAGVEPHRVVPTCPCGGDLLSFLQHCGGYTTTDQLRCTGQPGRSASDDDDVVTHDRCPSSPR